MGAEHREVAPRVQQAHEEHPRLGAHTGELDPDLEEVHPGELAERIHEGHGDLPLAATQAGDEATHGAGAGLVILGRLPGGQPRDAAHVALVFVVPVGRPQRHVLCSRPVEQPSAPTHGARPGLVVAVTEPLGEGERAGLRAGITMPSLGPTCTS